jgi:type IV secretory pathway VirB3-like protein
MFIYPGNLKEKKQFLYLTVSDFAIGSLLSVVFVVYSIENFRFTLIAVPILFFIFKMRILENSSNLWEEIFKAFNYLVDSQQKYFWGRKGGE